MILIILSIIIVSTSSAFALESVAFSLSDAECKRGRLVEITVSADSSAKLSASRFEFTYDKSIFEFRSVKATNSSSIVKANEVDDCVKVVFANTYGADVSGSQPIFIITLKAVSQGEGTLDFKAFDCVDADINSMNVDTCKSSQITVLAGSPGDETDDDDNKTAMSPSKSSNSSVGSKNGKNSTVSDGESTIDNLGLLNSLENRNVYYIIIGIAVGVVAVILIAGIFVLAKFIRNKRKPEK